MNFIIPRFENGCSENSTQKPLTKYSTEENKYIDLGQPRSVASVIYLDVVNNYTVIQHVKQILDDFVVSSV